MRRLLCLGLCAGSALATPAKSVDATLDRPDGTPIAAAAIKASASSTLCEGSGQKRACHEAARVLDDDRGTAWCEGVAGDGAGQWLAFAFDKPVELKAIALVAFYAKDFRRAEGNARPETLTVETDAGAFDLDLEDFPARVKRENQARPKISRDEPCGDETCASRDARINFDGQFSVRFGETEGAPKPMKTTRVKLTVKSAYPGSRAADLCISTVRFYTP